MYLAHRRRQGFTAALVSAAPIPHDRDERATSREPFRPDATARDFGRTTTTSPWPGAYTRIAHEEYGIRLMVVVLWNNYLPDTWGAAPHAARRPAGPARRAYVARVAGAIGDLAADLRRRRRRPLHRAGGQRGLPRGGRRPARARPRLPADHAHGAERDAARRDRRRARPPPAPVRPQRREPGADLAAAGAVPRTAGRASRCVASEPPYEQHGKVNGHGRWTREDVRRASWTSVLAGATAGIGYGAHGVWMWHTPTRRFRPRGTPRSSRSHGRSRSAFPGALDISLMARLFADHRLHRLAPAQDRARRRPVGSDPAGGEPGPRAGRAVPAVSPRRRGTRST